MGLGYCAPMQVLRHTGRSALDLLRRVRDMAGLISGTVSIWLQGQGDRAELRRRVARFGVAATPAAILSGLAVGFLMVMLPLELLSQVGGEPLGGWLAVPLIRDVAPLLAAFLVAGRARTPLAKGQAVSARVAAVLPAATVSSAGLFVVVVTSAVLGGYGFASLRTGTPFGAQLLWVSDVVSVVDVLHALGKTALFGVVVAAIRCYHGLVVRGSAGVLRAVVAVLALNVLLSGPYYRGLL